MDQDDYKLTWERLLSESVELESRRAELDIQLQEIKNQIEHLDEILRHLAPLAGMSFGEDLSGLGITDAIRTILENSHERMSAGDVRKALTEQGFDLSGYSAPMSSIYKVLGRLADDSSSPVFREKDGSGVFYMWKRNTASFNQLPSGSDDYANSTEITDDDIPF